MSAQPLDPPVRGGYVEGSEALMAHDDVDPTVAIRQLVDGYQVSQAIHVAATLGIADFLADGARTSDDLAGETGSDPRSLYRLLRALAAAGVFRELDSQRFELTPVGQLLRVDVDHSIAGWAVQIGRPYYWAAWAALDHSVRTGENAFQHVHGTDVWTYRSTRPEESAVFDRAMASLSRRTNAQVVAAYDFSRFATVVDVGGGTGAFLAAVLAAAPSTHGVLFDQAHVTAAAAPVLERFGVADRCDIASGNFFEAVPEGADAYTMRAVLHDWADDDAVQILNVVRRAIPDDGTLLAVERLIDPPNQGRAAKFSDLNMIVGPGGQERTTDEYARLFARAGFAMTRVLPAGLLGIVEATPASP